MTKTYTALTANAGACLLTAYLLACANIAAAQPQMRRLRGWGSVWGGVSFFHISLKNARQQKQPFDTNYVSGDTGYNMHPCKSMNKNQLLWYQLLNKALELMPVIWGVLESDKHLLPAASSSVSWWHIQSFSCHSALADVRRGILYRWSFRSPLGLTRAEHPSSDREGSFLPRPWLPWLQRESSH